MPKSSKSEILSTSNTSSNKPAPVRLIALVPLSKPTLSLAPWNFGLSWSSLRVWTNNFGCASGKSITKDVSPGLNREPSSCALRIYSPSNNGSSAEVVAPLKAWIRSVASWNVPVPSVLGLCLTKIEPPAFTSISGTGFHLSLINLSVIGS